MLFHEPKIAFIHIPRTGGTSVEHSMMKKYPQAVQLFGNEWYDTPVVKIRTIHTKNMPNSILEYHQKHATYEKTKIYYPDYKYYATVRHPERRLESLYALLHWSETNGIPWVTDDFNTWVGKFCNGFVMHDQDVLDTRMMCLSQSEFIGESEWHRMEDGTIFDALDIEPKHHYKLDDERYMLYWTDESKELVRETYAEDYERFNYEYE